MSCGQVYQEANVETARRFDLLFEILSVVVLCKSLL